MKMVDKLLLKFVADGNVPGAMKAIDFGAADTNCADDFGLTPLLIAAGKGNQMMVDLLMRHGADARCISSDGMYPMAIAASSGNIRIMQTIGANCWDSESPSSMISNALEIAFHSDQQGAAEHLIKHGADVFSQDGDGKDMITRMISCNNVPAIENLLAAGINWHINNTLSPSPLGLALQQGNQEAVLLLYLRAIDSPMIIPKKMIPPLVRKTPWQSSHESSSTQDTVSPWREFLITAKQIKRSLRWIFHWLHPRQQGQVKNTQQFIEALQNGNITKAQEIYHSGLTIAKASDQYATPLLILLAQALLKDPPIDELHVYSAQGTNRAKTAASLMARMCIDGANPLSRYISTGDTVAHILAASPYFKEFMEAMRVSPLIECLNASNHRMDRPLHISVKRRDADAIKGLLQMGCDRNPVNADGHAPLHICAFNCDVDTAAILMASGASIHLKTKRGQTIDKINESLGARAKSFDALIKAKQHISKVMSIFSPNNPMAYAVRLGAANSPKSP